MTIVLACLLAHGIGASAQDAPRAGLPDQIAIAVESFGVGGTAREGTWAAIRINLTDTAASPRAVAVRLHLPDPDGDTALMQRTVTLNPGLTQGVWMYGLMPWGIGPSSVMTVTVHEFDVNVAADDVTAGVGAQLAAERIVPQSTVARTRPVIGVLGRSPAAGLVLYENPTSRAQQTPATSHELTRVVLDLGPASVPDRWMGLAMFDTIAWFEGEPGTLNESQARALREWVLRGGNLIVSLPSAGQSWTNPRVNPLHDMLPVAEVTRLDAVDLRTHAALLQPRGGVELPAEATVHAIEPLADAAPSEAQVILAAPDGTPVAVRRVHGAGTVTLVGYDMSDTRIAARLDPRYFWHRVLGNRFEVLTRDEIRQLEVSGQASFPFFEPIRLDHDLASQIAKQGRAGAGVLLGLGVFALYLILAGPGGYGILRMRNATHHAWVAFVASIGAFAALAWGGATLLRPVKADVQHLTFFDHVFGESEQHAAIWFSALLPEYGEATVAIGSDEDRARWTQTLAAWSDPASTRGKPFPDTRGYVVDTRDPSRFTVPTRSTVKQFRADWLGNANLATPAPTGGPLTVGNGNDTRLRGAVTHSMPAALEDVTIVVVRGQKPLVGDLVSGDNAPILGRVSATRLVNPWQPGETIDFSQIPPSAWDADQAYFDRLTDALSSGGLGGFGQTATGLAAGDTDARLEALTWHAALRPPRFLSQSGSSIRLLQRSDAHGLELTDWLTTPCVIVVGHMTDAPSPAPILINGREAPSRGRTVVRWVYPLPAEPPTVPQAPAPSGAN